MGWRRLYARPARHLSDAGVASVKSRLLPAGAVCFSSIGSIGKVTLAVKPLVTNQQVNSVVVDHSVTSESYVYEALSHASERIRGMASGSATPIINKSTFADIRMVMTPPSLAHLFGREVGLLHSLITKLEEHSSRLGAIRDLLLPQLVTGQIDVSSLNLDTLIAEKVA
ncbi:restriction endonuclease subunit S [Ornithinimicrobium sp. INDO-MA30-4]